MDERMLKWAKDPRVVGFLALGVGLGIGYILGKRQQEYIHAVPAQDWSLPDLKPLDVETVPDIQEIEEVVDEGRAFVETRIRDVGIMTESSIPESSIETPAPERRKLFDGAEDTWDYDSELANRTETEPYVLHKDEFYNDEKGYTQVTLTYYAGDNIMADQEDTPIYNYETVVGPLLFGHGSGDPNVFHVRNDKLRAEYEVLRDQGLFSVEVLGLEIENNARVTDLKHSGDRKFRQE